MEINKKFLVLLTAGALVLGGVAGAYGDHYYYITRPQKIAMEQAKKQQDELNKMVRHGVLMDVKPNQITMKVTKAGEKEAIGKIITVYTDQYTNIQKDFNSISEPGKLVDLTQYLKPDMEIDVLVRDGKALAIHWVENQPQQQQEQQQQIPSN